MPGRGRAPVGLCSQILEACWESNNNLPSGQGPLKNRFPPQVKTAMVINGEFLVSVGSGLTVGPLACGRGLGGAADSGWGWTIGKAQVNATPRDDSQRDWSHEVKASLGLGQGAGGVFTKGRGAGRVMRAPPPPPRTSLLARTSCCCP